MHKGTLLVLLLIATSWSPPAEGILIDIHHALALGGLGILKGIVLSGFIAGAQNRSSSIGKRSVDQDFYTGENVLLSTVMQLDMTGCVLKLLCNLQAKEKENRTSNEGILLELFPDNRETQYSQKGAFVRAANIGSQFKDLSVCDKHFPECPLSDYQLVSLLEQSWGCGFDVSNLQINNRT